MKLHISLTIFLSSTPTLSNATEIPPWNKSEKLIESTAERCRKVLTLNSQEERPYLSAFKKFNDLPPVPGTKLTPDSARLDGLELSTSGDCLEPPPFQFYVLENGVLRKNRTDDLRTLHVSRSESGYTTAYLYKRYETSDGEGNSVVLALARHNDVGKVEAYIEEASSWYEYEGSIRMRDAIVGKNVIHITESIYHAERFDPEGNVLSYSIPPSTTRFSKGFTAK